MTRLASLGLLLWVTLAGGPQEDERYSLEGPGYSIVVNRVNCARPNASPCVVDYEYSFPGRANVNIVGIGDAPGSGKFRYISSSPILQFNVAPNAMPIMLRLRETSPTRGPVPEVPTYRDFSKDQSLSGSLSGDKMFSVIAQSILNQEFPAGYDPDLVRQNVHYYITAYQPVESGQRNLLIQVAVMISNPDPVDNPPAFRLKWVARKKRILDPEWQSLSETGPEAERLRSFLRHLLAQFQR